MIPLDLKLFIISDMSFLEEKHSLKWNIECLHSNRKKSRTNPISTYLFVIRMTIYSSVNLIFSNLYPKQRDNIDSDKKSKILHKFWRKNKFVKFSDIIKLFVFRSRRPWLCHARTSFQRPRCFSFRQCLAR